MGMPAQREMEWTAERALALPYDGNRYEVLDGALVVTPAPSLAHQWALQVLDRLLSAYVASHGIGWVLRAPADIVLSAKRLVQPDLFVVPRGERAPTRWSEIRALVLAVEVLSPSTARTDRHQKRIIYQSEGVPEYWAVDLEARRIERWRPDDSQPEVLATEMRWEPSAAASPLILDLPSLFAEIPAP
jgi:Uma2 family endonuclease